MDDLMDFVGMVRYPFMLSASGKQLDKRAVNTELLASVTRVSVDNIATQQSRVYL